MKSNAKLHLYFLSSIIALTIVFALSVYYAHSKGFCFKTGHFITDDEVKNIALQSIVNISHATSGSGTPERGYSNISELLEKNPSCCSLYTSSQIARTYNIVDRFLGNVYAALEVSYLQNPDGQGPQGLARVPVSVCGEIILEN